MNDTPFKSDLPWRPIFYTLPKDEEEWESLKKNLPEQNVLDPIDSQLKELIESRHPAGISDQQMEDEISAFLGGVNKNEIGVWVYYPWRQSFIHLLDEQEYIELRTSRNQYKISPEEQQQLKEKSIGVIGLSVGQSVSLALAMERGCGKLKLADFDHLELSNLNRIRTSVLHVGLPKVIATAREIAEIDPFLEIEIFEEGISEGNIAAFLDGNGGVDLLVDECDSLDIKVVSRFEARKRGIPVIMDTSDRGMLDVERFDLDGHRPILHGLAGDVHPEKLKGLSNAEKLPYVLKILGVEKLSSRAKASALEVNQSLKTWPQLASSVLLGGAAAADVARRILLNQTEVSGRFFVDVESIIPNKRVPEFQDRRPEPLKKEELKDILNREGVRDTTAPLRLSEQQRRLIRAASFAPSGGNVQPWKWVISGSEYFLFHEPHLSHSLLDFQHTGSYFALGAALENFQLEARSMGYGVGIDPFPSAKEPRWVARVSLNDRYRSLSGDERAMHQCIYQRVTNRKNEGRKPLDDSKLEALRELAQQHPEARLQLLTNEDEIEQIGEVAAEVERLRFLSERGHADFLNEIRWTKEEAETTRDGIEIDTLELDEKSKMGLFLSADSKAARHLSQWKLGGGLKAPMKATVRSASSVGLISMNKDFDPRHFLVGGRLGQRIWLLANALGMSFQPISPTTFFINRLSYEQSRTEDDYMYDQLEKVKKAFSKIFRIEKNETLIFMFRLNIASPPTARALRRPVEEIVVNPFSNET